MQKNANAKKKPVSGTLMEEPKSSGNKRKADNKIPETHSFSALGEDKYWRVKVEKNGSNIYSDMELSEKDTKSIEEISSEDNELKLTQDHKVLWLTRNVRKQKCRNILLKRRVLRSKYKIW